MKYILLFCMLILLTSQSSAWTIIRQPTVSNITNEALESFLNNDTTNEKLYTDYFQCGHFSRTLARNATIYNITLGGVILSPDNNFQDKNNHIVNYVYINGSLILIEPQTDQYGYFSDMNYKYYKLYPNGKYVPSRW